MAHKVFMSKASRQHSAGLDIANLLGKRAVRGEIGIEIEVEGNKFPKAGNVLIPSYWKWTKDGSLRGKDNAEYVLAQPIPFSDVPDAINSLWTMFSSYGSKLDESNRTSVHVHLNVGQFHLNRLTTFLAMYFSVEEILTEWCGEHRVGNLFCLRAKDAPAIVSHLKRFIQMEGAYEIGSGFHYAGVNAHALFKFGSIEIRSLRGCTNPQTILDWVAVLERMYKMSGEYKDPRTLVDSFSGEGPMAYLEMLVGDKLSTIKQNINLDNGQIMESLMDGIRLAQDLCYCRDWGEYKPVTLETDPFGRPMNKTTAYSYAQSVLAHIGGISPGGVGHEPGQNPPNQLLQEYFSAPSTFAPQGYAGSPAFVPIPDEDVNEEADEDDYDEYSHEDEVEEEDFY